MKGFVPMVLLALCCCTNASKICASWMRNVENSTSKLIPTSDFLTGPSDESQGDDTVKFVTCPESCYAAWHYDKTTNGSGIIMMFQGCWKDSDSKGCENTTCTPQKQSKALKNVHFCCCRGDYCNRNITDLPITHFLEQNLTESIPPGKEFLDQPESERWIIVGVLGCIMLVLCITVSLIFKVYRNNVLSRLGKPLSSSDQLMESTALRTGTYTVDHLKLTNIVGQGRYGSVWQGSMGDQDVAVKIFPSHYRNYFQNEKDIYCLPFMEHPSLLSYYGTDERVSMDGNVEHLLVLSFAPGGTLCDYLHAQTIDWASFCKMGLSVARGLAYLHTDVRKGDKLKPCVAHRDINSRNILVKADGTCCICDLGLAVQISGSKYFSNGEEQHAETKSINDVGTLRYMAPEVLEGAVNLRDCESSLKQIDVYAMGLVLWELVSRCSDIYAAGSEVPPYRQPFEIEVGPHPTFEQMQVLISRNKARPLLQGHLVDRPGVRFIKETMEDCWDPDAEARLTALCVEERLTDLQSHRVTVYLTDGSPMVNSYCTLLSSTTNSLYDGTHHDNVHVVQVTPNTHQSVSGSEAAVANLVALSPIESAPHEPNFKNSNETATCNQVRILQPYQGRNPCLERNLMLQSSSQEELGCNGNVLVDKSLKHTTNDQFRIPSESQNLVTHDFLSQHTSAVINLRPATPIPFVQNVITDNGAQAPSRRKQTNVPESISQEHPHRRRFAGWSNLKKLLVNKKLYPYNKCQIDREDSKSNLLTSPSARVKIVDTNVTISPGGKYVNGIVGKSSGKNEKNSAQTERPATSARPSTLPLVDLREERKRENNLSRQESLDKFNEVFNTGSNLNILKDPNMRIKTPGDLPPSVRKMRGRANSMARFSLYDDRMMCNIVSEEEGRNNRNISNSVPFGMDFSTNEDKISPQELVVRNVTYF